MHRSKKYQANSLYEGDFSLCDYTLTRQRYIQPTRVMDACAIVTAWQPSGVHCSKGIDAKDEYKQVPKEVLVHMCEKVPKGAKVPKGKGPKVPKGSQR